MPLTNTKADLQAHPNGAMETARQSRQLFRATGHIIDGESESSANLPQRAGAKSTTTAISLRHDSVSFHKTSRSLRDSKRAEIVWLYVLQGLLKIPDDVLVVLDSHRETNHLLRDTECAAMAFFDVHVGHRCRVLSQ